MSDNIELARKEFAEAIEKYRKLTRVYPQMWLEAYRDPAWSVEEREQRAWEAVRDGWRPEQEK